MRSELVVNGSHQRIMDIVGHEIERLNAIITDLLAYARPRPIEYADVDVHRLIMGTLALLCNGLPDGSAVTIQTRFASDVPSMTVDAQGLRQVMWNLCLNAVEAMQCQGTLTIRTAVQPLLRQPYQSDAELLAGTQELIIEMIDSGPSIPPEVKEKIFEPFYSTKEGGTGLGLATVDRIIHHHKGRIEVDSQPGHGTTMRIHLPILPSALDISSTRTRRNGFTVPSHTALLPGMVPTHGDAPVNYLTCPRTHRGYLPGLG